MTSSEGPQTSRQALRASRLLVKRWRAPSRWWSTGKHTRCLVIYIIWVPSLRMEILENPQGSNYGYVEAKLIILQGWKLLWLSMLSSSSWMGMDVTQSWCWVWSSRSYWSYLEIPDQVLGMFIGSWPTVQLQDFKMAKDLFSRSSEAVIVIWTDFIFNCYKESIPKKIGKVFETFAIRGRTRDAQRLYFQNDYSHILNGTTCVVHVLSHCPYGFLASTFIPIVFWVFLT